MLWCKLCYPFVITFHVISNTWPIKGQSCYLFFTILDIIICNQKNHKVEENMARLNSYQTCAAILIFVAAAMLVLPGRANISPASAVHKYTEDCEKRITVECGREIYYAITEDWHLTEGCCSQLLSIGESCHKALVHKSFAGPLAIRSAQIWEFCVDISPASSPSIEA